ncbi:MAG: hypothetical protein IPJ13_22465 [Saprospiraceae bacterium]|nr:hypothetical protein [Saprospiraceae bacterium]MBK9566245.1 hypothetical protein [Saprospiraceae bacterium]MBP6447654.1 hypothetical protein [Saprospiraceae bacterium]
MSPIFKNILVVILAIAAGMIAMMAGHQISNVILPPPEGMDVSNMESFVANAHKLTTGHWILALLSHAFGPLVSGFIVAKYSAAHHRQLLWIVAGAWIIAGVLNLMAIHHLLWFKIADILMYVPMTFIGAKLSGWKYSI